MALSSFIRLLIVGFICYFLIVLVLRVSGKRTLSKMNAFDFVVTVALGSVLSNILINNETLLMEGIVSFCLLVFLQFLSSWLSVHSPTVNSLLKSQPSLLYYDGNYYYKHMKKERISKDGLPSYSLTRNCFYRFCFCSCTGNGWENFCFKKTTR